MTTFAEILNSDVDVGSPLTTSLMTRYRNNIRALYEGDATLPQFPAGGLLLLDSQELTAVASTVQFDPTALSTFNHFRVASIGVLQNNSIVLQIRETAGTWRIVANTAALGANGRYAYSADIYNANNHAGFTQGSGNTAIATGTLSEALVGSFSRTNTAFTGDSPVDFYNGYAAFAEDVDEIRLTSGSGANFAAGSIFLLYGVRSGTIEGTAT